MPIATILIPTHTHADTIIHAINSVQHQTIEDFELFVIGDGAPDRTNEIMNDFVEQDVRIRYYPHSKGEGNGELYRVDVLNSANGKIVCYLADDDMWLPNHLEIMVDILKTADFAHTIHCYVDRKGRIKNYTEDLQYDFIRRKMLNNKFNYFGPTCVAHTLSSYKKLPFGWRPRPEGIWSDLYMWRQWFEQPWCKYHSEPIVTSLHFPSPLRHDMNISDRVSEMEHWWGKIQDRGFANWVNHEVYKDWQRRVVEPHFFYQHGLSLMKEKDWFQAEEIIKKAIEINPLIPRFHHQLSISLYRQEKIDEAISAGKEAIKLKDDHPVFYLHMGNLLTTKNQQSQAEEMFRRSVSLDVNNPRLHRRLAQCLMEQGDSHGAIISAKTAVQLDPNNSNLKKFLTHIEQLMS